MGTGAPVRHQRDATGVSRRPIVAYTLSITHLPDIGGTGFGAAASEIYHEGLRLPIGKLVRAGEIDPS